MPPKNQDLHGNVPDKASVALLLIDVINDLEWDGADAIADEAIAMGERLAALKAEATKLGIPSIYVNDNFGKWQSNFEKQVEHCLHDGVRGEPLVKRLRPDPKDYFVLKPKHSGFFSTTLELLLEYLGARTLVLAGLTTNSCVLFTAHDAYMRDFHLFIPSDCVVGENEQAQRFALDHLRTTLGADTRPSVELDLPRLLQEAEKQSE